MVPTDLEYENLSPRLAKYVAKGYSESASLLGWFLENIFRLNDTAAQDAICDKPNDKGIDGIYLDEFSQEITLFQSKIKQGAEALLGDSSFRSFMGSISQFGDASKMEMLLNGGANNELKNLIVKNELAEKIRNGFTVRGVFVTNSGIDQNAREYLSMHPNITLYDKQRICEEYIDLDSASGVQASFSFECEVAPVEFQVASLAKLYITLVSAQNIVLMPGIGDGSLFSQNVRLNLGNTDVNRGITKSIQDKSEHKKFVLYHNGATLICSQASLSGNILTVKNFVVVNGAQSISALFANRKHLTTDLRILLRIIEVKDNEQLLRQITQNSNTQNAIKARDLKSNHIFQTRLKKEFDALKYKNYVFEVKRGEKHDGKKVLTNEEAGRLLLAFDLEEPYACHQIYRVFDELYVRIFGRPEVNARRILFIHHIMEVVEENLISIKLRPLAGYTLTRFMILDIVAQILRLDARASSFVKDPSPILQDENALGKFRRIISEIVKLVILEINYEAKERGDDFDYKSFLKNMVEVQKLRNKILKEYERELVRERQKTFSALWDEAPQSH